MIETSEKYSYLDAEKLMTDVSGRVLPEDLEERRAALFDWINTTFVNMRSGHTLNDDGVHICFPYNPGGFTNDVCDLTDLDFVAGVARGDYEDAEWLHPYYSVHMFHDLRLDAASSVSAYFPPDKPCRAELYIPESEFRTSVDAYGSNLADSHDTIPLARQLNILDSDRAGMEFSVRDVLQGNACRIGELEGWHDYVTIGSLLPEGDSTVVGDFDCRYVEWRRAHDGGQHVVIGLTFATPDELLGFKRAMVHESHRRVNKRPLWYGDHRTERAS